MYMWYNYITVVSLHEHYNTYSAWFLDIRIYRLVVLNVPFAGVYGLHFRWSLNKNTSIDLKSHLKSRNQYNLELILKSRLPFWRVTDPSPKFVLTVHTASLLLYYCIHKLHMQCLVLDIRIYQLVF